MNFLKITSVAIALLISQLSMAQTRGAGDDYSSATPGASASSSIKDIMARDATHITCEKGLCTLFSVTVNKQSFTISSYVGTGSQSLNSGGGVNNYYGNTSTPQNTGTLGYGLQITWDNTHCTKNVDVDKSVYNSITTYMSNLINTKPGEDPTYPQFTPAEQTMIMFYTTVMELTKGTTCN